MLLLLLGCKISKTGKVSTVMWCASSFYAPKTESHILAGNVGFLTQMCCTLYAQQSRHVTYIP